MSAENYIQFANEKLHGGDWLSAIKAFTQALQFDATNPHAWMGRGAARLNALDIEGARDDLHKAKEAFLAQGDMKGYKKCLDLILALPA